MTMSQHAAAPCPVAPALLWDWLAGRSLARDLPPPVPDRGGMRVDTAASDEVRRYVFAAPAPAIRALAASIRDPRIFIKLCGPGDALLALAPPGWRLQPEAWFMTQAGTARDAAPLPPGYRIDVARNGHAFVASILSEDGTLAAGGHAARFGGAFVFDRIETHPAHRRRGLGTALMAALGALPESAGATGVLVATGEGRALYETLGWAVASAYSTICLPA
jgi:GNAT superfamily N-acetyltransferase